MNELLSKSLFEEQTEFCTDAKLLSLRNWKIVIRSYPILEVEFLSSIRNNIRVRMNCDNWDESPPSTVLLDDNDRPLREYPRGHGLFNNSPHPIFGRPFICSPGSLEYHQHQSHVNDLWDNYRGKTGYDLGGILTQIWNAWNESK